MSEREVLAKAIGLGDASAVVDEAKKEAPGAGMFVLGFLLGAGTAAAVTYLWLENESRTVYSDSRAYRYGRRPGS